MKYLFLIIAVLVLLSVNNVFSQSITWQRTYNGPYNFYDYGEDACNADNGNFYIVGHLFEQYIRKIYVLKINPYGDTIWTRIFGTSINQQALCVESTEDGGCIFSGYWDSAYTMKLLPDGSVGWLKFYNTLRYYRCKDIIKSNSSGYLLCGYDDSYTSSIIKIDSTGNFQWSKSFQNILFQKMTNAHDSGYIVCANQIYSGGLLRLNNSGEIQWSKTFGGSFTPILISMISNGYILGGVLTDSTILSKGGFVRIDKEGNNLYQKKFETLYDEYLETMAIANDNKYIFGIQRDSVTTSFFKPIICDSLGNIIKTNYFPVREAHTFSSDIINNGDILFAGWYKQPVSGDRDVYAIRTDSNLNAPLIGIKKINGIVPSKNIIINCYPNPFNNSARIKFNVNEKSYVSLDLIDVTGQKLNIFSKLLERGTFEYNYNNQSLSSGIYFCVLYINNIINDKRKIILIK